ncbi:amidophosphoribosyltransferase [Pasteurellaceae bacterium RH1A]|nr:amidophosphoribosyltransferase [Pasteurellaceae bacterium RH1A]
MNLWQFSCFHCKGRLALAQHGICSPCNRSIERTPYCGGCGAVLPEYHRHCGNCLRDEPKWQHFVHVGWFKPPLTDWISRFKFQQAYWLDRTLARLLLLAIKNAQREHGLTLPEVIMPVPLFWQRHWQRGYNQAELLAQPLAKWLQIPLDTQSLKRTRATRPQRELSGKDRRRNLRGAFAYQPLKAYKRVALVDDVVTTGSTLNTICAELRKQGVEDIQVWALCRA